MRELQWTASERVPQPALANEPAHGKEFAEQVVRNMPGGLLNTWTDFRGAGQPSGSLRLYMALVIAHPAIESC